MNAKIAFTKKDIEAVPLPAKGRAYVHDTKVNGLVLQVTPSGTRSFQVYRKVDGKPIRVTLGRYPDMTIEQARKNAQSALAKLADGVNPNQEKKAQRAKAITLGQVFEDYLKARKALKPGTIHDYHRVMNEALPDWKDKPLASIDRDMAAKRHSELGERSEARANNAMRVLRAIFNFAEGEYRNEFGEQLFTDNPVKKISHTRAWYRVERRQTLIKTHELKPWIEAVLAVENDTLKDYLLLMLFTGLRRNEAATLRWDDVDLVGKTLTIRDPKNRQDHTLPLSDVLFGLLNRRKATATSNFVFPGTGENGHIVEPRKQIDKVIQRSGIKFTPHDLRRTFITLAESLDISSYAVKRLANHKIAKSDVTAGYVVSDVERLRRPMQQITDFIMQSAGIATLDASA